MPESCWCARIATERKSQGTIFCFEGSKPCKKRLMKDALRSRIKAKYSAIPNHTRVSESSKRRCRKNRTSRVIACFMAVQIERNLCLFIWLAQSFAVISDKTKLLPASVLRLQMAVCTVVFAVLYDMRSLYVGSGCKGHWSASGRVPELLGRLSLSV